MRLKLPHHARSHGPGGSDPLTGLGYIQYHVNNVGDYLKITNTSNFSNAWATFVSMMVLGSGSTVIASQYFDNNEAGIIVGDGNYFFRVMGFDQWTTMSVNTDGSVEINLLAGSSFEIKDHLAASIFKVNEDGTITGSSGVIDGGGP